MGIILWTSCYVQHLRLCTVSVANCQAQKYLDILETVFLFGVFLCRMHFISVFVFIIEWFASCVCRMLNVQLYGSFIIKEFLISCVFCCSVCVYVCVCVSAASFYEVGWTFWNVWLVVGSPWCCVTTFQLQITLLDFMKCEVYIVSLLITQHGGYLSLWGGHSDPLTGFAVLSWIPTGYNSFTGLHSGCLPRNCKLLCVLWHSLQSFLIIGIKISVLYLRKF